GRLVKRCKRKSATEVRSGGRYAALYTLEPLTSSPPLKKGEDSYEAWFGFNQSISAGSCFIDRPYCAASPQASHIGLPGPRSCEKELHTKTCALYPRSQERNL